jgi:hypothetical protein
MEECDSTAQCSFTEALDLYAATLETGGDFQELGVREATTKSFHLNESNCAPSGTSKEAARILLCA